MIVKLLAEHHLEFLSLKGGSTCSSESTLVKMPHCWKSHATASYGQNDLTYIFLLLSRFDLGLHQPQTTAIAIQVIQLYRLYESLHFLPVLSKTSEGGGADV